MSDERVARVPVADTGEPFVDLRTRPGLVLDARLADPERSGGACYTAASGISPDARRNRDLLGEVLTAVGMVNYPTEWWHWSYGDRYWALGTGAPAALYGDRHVPPVVIRGDGERGGDDG